MKNLTNHTIINSKVYGRVKALAKKTPGPEHPRLSTGRFIFPLCSNATLYHQTQPFQQTEIHNRFVLIFNFETKGVISVENRRLCLQPGQALLIFPFERHKFESFEQNRILWLLIEFETENTQPLLALKSTPVLLAERSATVLNWLCSMHTSNTETVQMDTNRHILLLDLLLVEMLLTLNLTTSNLSIPTLQTTAQSELFSKIKHYLLWNMYRPIKIGDLASAVGISPSYLQSFFKLHMHMSLGRYIRRDKIAHASRLMEFTDMNISQIAMTACGFDSLFSFSRCFKSETGVTPSIYRKQHNAMKLKAAAPAAHTRSGRRLRNAVRNLQ